MELVDKIQVLVGPALEDMGYEIVRVQLLGSKRKTLQVMIDRLDDAGLTIDDCAEASHTISALLEVEDPIHEAYNLEISSPGLDRPLVKLADFDRFAGQRIKIELRYPLEGRKRFQGLLQGVKEEKVLVECEDMDDVVEFDYSDIQKAKIIPDYE